MNVLRLGQMYTDPRAAILPTANLVRSDLGFGRAIEMVLLHITPDVILNKKKERLVSTFRRAGISSYLFSRPCCQTHSPSSYTHEVCPTHQRRSSSRPVPSLATP